MFGKVLGAAIASTVLLVGANVLQAQTTPTPGPGVAPTLDSCRSEAIRRGISGDALSGFLSNCLAQPAAGTQRAGLDRCRADAISRGLAGEARNTAIDDCMAQSGEAGSDQTAGTYRFCRAQSRTRGITGAELDSFMNSCVVSR